MKPPPFAYAAPESIEAAIGLLKDGARLISGGQSLMPILNFRLAAPSVLVDLRKITGLNSIVIDESGVRLGARVLWREIEDDVSLAAAHPLLCAAIAHVAHYQVRNRGTVGGSLAHGDPASEMPGVAVACDAEIVVQGPRGKRSIAAAAFFLGPLTTALGDDEIILEVRLPAWPAGRHWAFEEFSRRRGDFAIAGVLVFWDGETIARDVHVGVIGACSRPQRLAAAEAVLEGRAMTADLIADAAAAASAACDPADDLHGTEAYRRALVGTLLSRCLERAA